MKKISLSGIFVLGLLFFGAIIYEPMSAQSDKKSGVSQNPIPENVMKIASKSCVKCHTEPGNKMAMIRLNLSKWDKYSLKMQTNKAEAMCKMVTENKMPPAKFREKNPGSVPSADEIKTICDWAEKVKAMK